jgi:hypothetical protein
MIKGIDLTLMIGPLVPVPAPREVLDALTSIEVSTASSGKSGFSLKFTLSTHSPLHTLFLLSGGSIAPIVRVVIAVTVNGTSEVLIDGVMTDHHIEPGNEKGTTTLTVQGDDLSAVMDYIDFSGTPFPAMPAEVRVLLLVAKYSFLGVIPKVIPSVMVDLPIPVDKIPSQQGTDLSYIKGLADDVGYVFYMEPGPVPGTSFAYWGPEIKIGDPQPALNINMDAYTNIESISFSYDAEKKEMPIVFIQDEFTKVPIPIPIPDVNPLNPPLGLIPAIPKKFPLITGTAKYSPIRGILIGLAKAARSSDTVSATGTLNVLRYGHILKARKLVGVRGAGTAFDGLYYVASVTHIIRRGEYKQNFTLSRNGLVSIVPEVNP